MVSTGKSKSEASKGPSDAPDFDDLLKHAIRPRTEAAAKEVDAAVQALAREALANSDSISQDVVETVSAMISAIEKKISEQVEQIQNDSRYRDVKEFWERVQKLSGPEDEEQFVELVLTSGGITSQKDRRKDFEFEAEIANWLSLGYEAARRADSLDETLAHVRGIAKKICHGEHVE